MVLFLEIPYIYGVKFKVLIILSGIALFAGCGKFNLSPEVVINFQDPKEVTETGFQLNWSVNPNDYQSLTFILAEDPSFMNIVSTKTFPENSSKSITIEGLRGAATYYYRISLVRAPGDIFISGTESIELPFQQEFISFPTPDSATLKGSVYYRGALDGRRPAILMMHEFGIFVNGWINSDVLKLLVAEGYICMIYSNRGHGSSSSIDNIGDLLDNPDLLGNDLRGAMSYIQQNERVMADSIGLMGGSMGASMSITGNGDEAVITSVALSPANINIGSMYPGVPLSSIFYIVGDQDIVDTGDGVIDFPAQAAQLFELTRDPKRMLIIKNSIAHGTDLLETTGLNEEILDWFTKQMPVSP